MQDKQEQLEVAMMNEINNNVNQLKVLFLRSDFTKKFSDKNFLKEMENFKKDKIPQNLTKSNFKNDNAYANYLIINFLTTKLSAKEWETQFNKIISSFLELNIASVYANIFFLFTKPLVSKRLKNETWNKLINKLLLLVKEKNMINGFFKSKIWIHTTDFYQNLNENNIKLFVDLVKNLVGNKDFYWNNLNDLDLKNFLNFRNAKEIIYDILATIKKYFQEHKNINYHPIKLLIPFQTLKKQLKNLVSENKELNTFLITKHFDIQELIKLVDEIINSFNKKTPPVVPEQKSVNEPKIKNNLSTLTKNPQVLDINPFWEILSILHCGVVQDFINLKFNYQVWNDYKNKLLATKTFSELTNIDTLVSLIEEMIVKFDDDFFKKEIIKISTKNLFSIDFKTKIEQPYQFDYFMYLSLLVEIELLIRKIVLTVKKQENKQESLAELKTKTIDTKLNGCFDIILDFLNKSKLEQVKYYTNLFNSINYFLFDLNGLNLRNVCIHKLNEFKQDTKKVKIYDKNIWTKFLFLVVFVLVNFYETINK